MRIRPTSTYGAIIPGSDCVTSLVRQGTISREAAKRLRWMDHYSRHGNARLTCRYFGISAQTFYRWLNRSDPYDLRRLESGSHRPIKVRQPETKVEVVERVMKRLRARGVLVEPENVRLAKLTRRRRRKPRYAIRMPRGYPVKAPGDLVQVDTLKLALMSNHVRYQFSARDVVSRWDAARSFRRQTSFAAALFLEYLLMAGRSLKKTLPTPFAQAQCLCGKGESDAPGGIL